MWGNQRGSSAIFLVPWEKETREKLTFQLNHYKTLQSISMWTRFRFISDVSWRNIPFSATLWYRIIVPEGHFHWQEDTCTENYRVWEKIEANRIEVDGLEHDRSIRSVLHSLCASRFSPMIFIHFIDRPWFLLPRRYTAASIYVSRLELCT